ncbi:hypothetical protein, partial [Roseobacter litoralis]|uniref:hypothetical protein n=1 Tax=Roseobacter litoralis TaxID=42443 RepID=UPI0024948FF2
RRRAALPDPLGAFSQSKGPVALTLATHRAGASLAIAAEIILRIIYNPTLKPGAPGNCPTGQSTAF